jgi:hypothetical protein
MKYLYSFFLLLLLLVSCHSKKDPGKALSALDLSGAYAFVLATDSISGGRLYKLTDNDEVQLVRLYNDAGDDLTSEYSIENIYEINSDFMLMITTFQGQSKSYILQYFNGTLEEVGNFFRPQYYSNGAWVPDDNTRAVLNPTPDVYYVLGNQMAIRLSYVVGAADFTNTALSEPASSQFGVDAQDDVFFGNRIISPYDTTWTIDFWNEATSFVAPAYDNGFWVSSLMDSRLAYHHLYTVDGVLKHDTISPLPKPVDNCVWKGGYAFPDLDKTLMVYNFGIVSISGNTRRYFPLDAFRMGRFDACCASDSFLFISGANMAGQVSFIRINPESSTLTYSDVFASNLYDMELIHVDHHSHGAFMATRVKDNVSIFGYFTPTLMKVKENYRGLKVKQVLALR